MKVLYKKKKLNEKLGIPLEVLEPLLKTILKIHLQRVTRIPTCNTCILFIVIRTIILLGT